MPVEPGIGDANVLVYAFDTKAPQHVASRTLLDAGRTGTTTLYVTLQVLCEFYSIVTNARRVLKPRSSADALAAISDMLGFLRVLPGPVTAIDEVMALLRRRPVTGGEIFDLQIVATMKLNAVSRIYTFNTGDFNPFSEIEPLTP
jgi:predicted nucleic acid-binding protein